MPVDGYFFVSLGVTREREIGGRLQLLKIDLIF